MIESAARKLATELVMHVKTVNILLLNHVSFRIIFYIIILIMQSLIILN